MIDRFNKIEEHNKKFRNGDVHYNLGLNEFSHLSDEEIAKQKTGLLPTPANFSGGLPASSDFRRGSRAIPEAFDWRSGKLKKNPSMLSEK